MAGGPPVSGPQHLVLHALGRRSHTAAQVAAATGMTAATCQRTLDALYRRSWATITPAGRWCATERGRRKIGRP